MRALSLRKIIAGKSSFSWRPFREKKAYLTCSNVVCSTTERTDILELFVRENVQVELDAELRKLLWQQRRVWRRIGLMEELGGHSVE